MEPKEQEQGSQGWYKYGNINSFGISYHYDPSMSSADVFEEELETVDIHNEFSVALCSNNDECVDISVPTECKYKDGDFSSVVSSKSETWDHHTSFHALYFTEEQRQG